MVAVAVAVAAAVMSSQTDQDSTAAFLSVSKFHQYSRFRKNRISWWTLVAVVVGLFSDWLAKRLWRMILFVLERVAEQPGGLGQLM